nr:hypothetical protein [uncultured bacterium]
MSSTLLVNYPKKPQINLDIHRSEYRKRRPANAPIEHRILTFLSREIAAFAPDMIIVHERKGTAILRALIESENARLDWAWDKVISSASLDHSQVLRLAGKRILVFDDMLRTGKHVTEIIQELNLVHGDSEQTSLVHICVFAAHEDSPFGVGKINKNWSFSAFYSGLTTAAYTEIRGQIVDLLQRSGSLMLDTEHIEVRFRLKGSISRLVDCLRRRAEVIVFSAEANRTNLTIYYDNTDAHRIDESIFPPGTDCQGIVKKCRIVQRQTDEFAIIPLCLPTLQESVQGSLWPTSDADRSLFSNYNVTQSPQTAFYSSALLASFYPLRWILRDMYAGESDLFELSLPKQSHLPGQQGYGLEHLQVMYPYVDVAMLTERIISVEQQARSEGKGLRGVRRNPRPHTETPTDDTLRRHAVTMLQLLSIKLDEYRLHREFALGKEAYPSGLTLPQIFRMVKERLAVSDHEVSALFDILIDGAKLVTRVERVSAIDGKLRIERTFKPDGEIIEQAVREFTTQFGVLSY